VSFPAGTFARSIDLTKRFGSTLGVRTLDSLHVGCALELKAERFWTFDDRQVRLAEAVGLDTTA
jgi:predicted nucleic acid-binding protein